MQHSLNFSPSHRSPDFHSPIKSNIHFSNLYARRNITIAEGTTPTPSNIRPPTELQRNYNIITLYIYSNFLLLFTINIESLLLNKTTSNSHGKVICEPDKIKNQLPA